MRIVGVVCAVLLAASCTRTDSVLVQLVSDMAPGREIDVAVVTLDGAGDVTTPIPATASLGRPVRLASFASVPSGRHSIGVSLRLGRREVLARTVTREIGGSTIVTVLMTRDCTGVVCPGSGSPTAVACLGGQCVEPGCDEEHPELCPSPQCQVDADCHTASTVACAPERCSGSGVCFSRPDDALCSAGQLCDGQLGCVAVGSDAGVPTDGGLDAASTDAGHDAGRDAGQDAGTTSCPVGQHFRNGVCHPFLDVNGDGFADLVVGAQAYMSSQGRVDLYLGGASGLTFAGTFFHGVANERVGFTVVGVGDTDGDHLDDFLVSGHNSATTSQAYFFRGSASYPTTTLTPDVALPNESTEFSQFMAGVGDQDGDGLGDAVIGRDGTTMLYSYRGHAGAGLSATPDAMFAIPDLGMLSGGDLDGDGRGDFVASGPLGGTGEHVRVFLSRAGAYPTTPDATLTCPDGTALNFGPSAILDVNGDGLNDLAVGASGGATGAVYVFQGRASASPNAVPLRFTATGHTGIGHWITSLGDADRDGYEDLAIVGDGLTQVIVARGSSMGLVATTAVYALPVRAGRTQVRLAAADFDGDDEVDLAVGDPAANSVYVIRGPLVLSSGDLTETWTLAPSAGGFGGALAAR